MGNENCRVASSESVPIHLRPLLSFQNFKTLLLTPSIVPTLYPKVTKMKIFEFASSTDPDPEVIKKIMLSQAEHEIFPAHKC